MNEKILLNTKVEDLLRNYINKRVEQLYTKFYTGKVVDNNDPEKKYRCKIRVYGIYTDEIPDSDLPWALADMGFVGSKVGSVIIPPKDAIVRVYFDDGNIYNPIYTSKAFDINNISTEMDEDYPDVMVMFETDAGEYFKINRKTNVTTYHTATGVLITITDKGSIEISAEDSEEGNFTLKDKSGNKLEMTPSGVKINDKFLLTEDFTKWLFTEVQANFGLGNMGAPVPIFPATLTTGQTKDTGPAMFKTNLK